MMLRAKTIGAVFILLLACCFLLHAEDNKPSFKYKVVSVLDGDTFITTDGNVTFRVRIAAMDAPEKGQPYSKAATQRLRELIKGRSVHIDPIKNGTDQYGRTLGIVQLGDTDIALQMISEGLATYYRPTCKDYPADKEKYTYDPRNYITAEKEARQKKLNIWKHPFFQYPCKYRRNKVSHSTHEASPSLR